MSRHPIKLDQLIFHLTSGVLVRRRSRELTFRLLERHCFGELAKYYSVLSVFRHNRLKSSESKQINRKYYLELNVYLLKVLLIIQFHELYFPLAHLVCQESY